MSISAYDKAGTAYGVIGRSVHGGLALTLVAAVVLAPLDRAEAAMGSAGYCPDASGVTVVVDFNELGGGAVVRCAPGDQATGLAALKNAGFQVTGTLRWGEGFICRIEGRPEPVDETCVDTPPASAYWSYWSAPNGGTWSYSDKGVLNRKPPAGSFEGWSFSLGRSTAPHPGVAPERPAPPPPPPAPVPPPPVEPPDGGTAPDGGAGPDQPPNGQPTTVPPVGAGTPAPGTGASPAAVPTGTGAPATPSGQVSGGDPALAVKTTTPAGTVLTGTTPTSGSGGMPLGTLLGVLLLTVLTAGGVLAARRRRATGSGG